MDNQWLQWLPLFGFGSVVTILIAIFGVGIGLWRNAGNAHKTIGENIARLDTKLDSKVDGVTARFDGKFDYLASEVASLNIDMAKATTNINWIKNQFGGPRSNN